jgi:hypothetical protein
VLAIVVTWFVARSFSRARARATALIGMLTAFALIPTWDIVPGKVYFDHLCRTKAGARIYDKAERVKGFRFASGAPDPQLLGATRYRYLEGTDALGRLVRYSFDEHGKVVQQWIAQPTSRYVFQIIGGTWMPLSFNVKRYQGVIIDTASGSTLATITSFSHAGNWIQKRAAPLLDGGRVCPASTNYTDLFLSVLQP